MPSELTCQYYLRQNYIVPLKKMAEFADGLKQVNQEVAETHKAPIILFTCKTSSISNQKSPTSVIPMYPK